MYMIPFHMYLLTLFICSVTNIITLSSVDFVLALAWFAAFGLLVNALGPVHCGGVFHRGGDSHGGICGKWKASEAFSFLSAIFWLVSALLVSSPVRSLVSWST